MGKFNLRKKASVDTLMISEKNLEKNRISMNLSNDQQGVVGKNINLSLPIKDKDNTIPFNQQLNASRKNKVEESIIEARMSDKIVDFKSKDKKQVMDINVESQKYDNEKTKAFIKAQNSSKADTEFWDKYVGVQLEGKMKDVSGNLPASGSQLPNNPDRFKEDSINKMVMAGLYDADSMLFNIFAKASYENRELTAEENQQVRDINYGKTYLLHANGFYNDPIIKEESSGVVVYDSEGSQIDKFANIKEARDNYPEAIVINE